MALSQGKRAGAPVAVGGMGAEVRNPWPRPSLVHVTTLARSRDERPTTAFDTALLQEALAVGERC